MNFLSWSNVQSFVNVINLMFQCMRKYYILNISLLDWFIGLFCLRVVIGATGNLLNTMGTGSVKGNIEIMNRRDTSLKGGKSK